MIHVQMSLRTSLLQPLVNNNNSLLCAALGVSGANLTNVNRFSCKVLYSFKGQIFSQPSYFIHPWASILTRPEPTMLSFSFTHILLEKSYPWRLSTNTTSSKKPSLISPSGNDLTLLWTPLPFVLLCWHFSHSALYETCNPASAPLLVCELSEGTKQIWYFGFPQREGMKQILYVGFPRP